jgi:hypothetical protein
MGALRKRMNSSVGSTGAMHANGIATDSLEGALKMILDCIAM